MSASNRKKVIAYIDNQKTSQETDLEEEFLAFLKAAGVDYDPRFVFV